MVEFVSTPRRFFELAARQPERPAYFIRGDSGWTATDWRTYAGQVRQLAHAFIARGVQRGDVVAILGFNRPEWSITALAAMSVGASVAGIYWTCAPVEVAHVLEHSQARVLVIEDAAQFAKIASERARFTALRDVVAMRGASFPGATEWDEYLAAGTRVQAAELEQRISGLRPEDLGSLIYTSGTTGLPKGVQITDSAYLDFFVHGVGAKWAEYQAGDVVLVAMPMFHVAGINTGILTAGQGAKGIILEQVDPVEILTLIETEKVQHAFFVPAVINFLLQVNQKRPTDFSSLERVFYGASPIAEDLLVAAQNTMGCSFTQLYGMTESLGAGTYLPPEAHDPALGKLRSCGKPWPGFEVQCMREDGTPAPVGEVGEIAMRSTVLMKGYWNRPEATAETVRDGWLYTGDAGYFDADGYLYIHDRVKDMIVSGGENVYPAEVENAVFGHESVADVAVIGVPDEKWGEAVKAIVVLKPGAAADPEGIIAYTKGRIAGYKVPKTVDFIDALPRNPSGKILRRELREPYWAGHTRRVA